jgi:NAD(P)-dependent dehydrogenase (short-subunit alcohol dehydrogenase family)
MMNLDGRLALVTGAGRGIGRAIALGLAGAGAELVINDRDAAVAEAVAREVEALGRRACARIFDVTDEAAVQSGFAAAAEAMGRPIDILVNNAGIGDFVSFPDITAAKWDAMLDTHLKGAFLCCHAALPGMMQRGHGKILNISSVAGKRGDFIGNAHYTAAKAGMLGLTRSLGAYAAPHGVNVNAIAPGIVDTALTSAMSEAHKAATLARVPIGRFAATEEIAAAAVFLVSDAASYIVGETLNVNGGSYMD